MSTEAADVGTSAGAPAATAAVVVGFSSPPLAPSPAPFQPRPSDPMLLPLALARSAEPRARGISLRFPERLRAETRRNEAKQAHPVRFDRRRGDSGEGSVTRREREKTSGDGAERAREQRALYSAHSPHAAWRAPATSARAVACASLPVTNRVACAAVPLPPRAGEQRRAGGTRAHGPMDGADFGVWGSGVTSLGGPGIRFRCLDQPSVV